jgi:multidrug efflux pump subunit AcrA (membrane-fusion protein)
MFWASISRFNKLNVFWRLSLLIVALIISYYVYSHWFTATSSVTTYNLATVSRGDIITSVAGTGQVIADSQVDVKAQGSGQITAIYIAQGDTVRSGQIIARLDSRSAATSLAQAHNNYRSAQANYNKTVSDLTTNENALAQTQIDTAKTSLLNTQQSVVDKLKLTYVQTLDLVNATNKLFVVPTDAYPIFSGDSILFNNDALVSQVVHMRSELNQELPTLKQTLDQTQASTAFADIGKTALTLEKAYTYFDTLNRLFVNYSI